ncbi:LysR family transcriptional regulator [uncultured Sulfitobacter sp.]|uniref:LysR family transcriptional regulator n=1 Tax=uncultured Sulfitobacter sp. TaxID=191468 RepID=UPI002598F59A|nr:LysR family transcriptional regulator [uncultured Sulfitobacter sp.]
MSQPRLNWDDARPFLAVARLGTLSSAASHLQIGIATLSRRIERLERALGVPLFARAQSGYRLTEDGVALLDKAEALEAAALSFSSTAAARAEISGRVRLATAETLAAHVIIPALPRFINLYPRLTVEIITDIQTADLHRRDADVALRMVAPERGNISIQRVGTMGWGLYANRKYLERNPVASNVASLEGHSIITWSEKHVGLSSAKLLDRLAGNTQARIETTDLPAQLAAARAGLGVASLPHFLARSADLVCVRDSIGLDQPIFLVMQSDLSQSARIRAICEFLREIVAEHRSELQPEF